MVLPIITCSFLLLAPTNGHFFLIQCTCIILDAWCSTDHNKKYVFFQVKLPQLALVSGISVQGGKDILQKMNDYWVTE